MNRFTKTLFAIALTTLAAQSYAAPTTKAAASVNPAEKAKIEAVVHDYILNNPQVIVEALQAMQRKQYEQAELTVKKTQQTAASFAKPLFNQANDPVAGNVNGKITVVEFFDYQCPHCIDMAPVIAEIIKNNADVRIVFKEFPIRGPMSEVAARAALAANIQGKYYEFSHNLLVVNKPLSEEVILDVAKKSGLDVDKLQKDMKGDVVNKQLADNMKLAQDLKLFGTPAFFIGKTNGSTTVAYIPGQMDQKQLQTEIDKANKAS